MTVIDELMKKLDSHFGNDRTTYTTAELKKSGIFGPSGGRTIIRMGCIPFVRLSPRRRVISKRDLLEYLLKNTSEALGDNDPA